MEHQEKQLSVVWRGRNFLLEMDECAKLKDLGERLQKLTDVQIDTLRLIVPEKKGSKLLYPFSDEHSNLPLEALSVVEGKSIRMMGVPENEVEQVLQSVKTDLRIAGFDEEEKRLRKRAAYNHKSTIQLPQGNYVFSAFRTLSLPGIELKPPASEALRILHTLAADPGIVAVMNKHRWRVGILTEMAPVGYVGVSPKCILGYNQNKGEEISLRLRTDDLKGFRKYESIKSTLLHELTHMVFSEHDADFLALNSQLNKEAAALDWTKSKGHTLNIAGAAIHYEEEYDIDNDVGLSHKLGGQELGFSTARASSVAAAYRRVTETSPNVVIATDVSEVPDQENDPLRMEVDGNPIQLNICGEEPDPDDSQSVNGDAIKEMLPRQEITKLHEPMDMPYREPDPDDSQVNLIVEKEPEPDYNRMVIEEMSIDQSNEPDPDDSQVNATAEKEVSNDRSDEPDPDDCEVIKVVGKEHESDHSKITINEEASVIQSNEPDPDDMDLQRIQDPAIAIYSRLQKAMNMLRSEVAVLQTLLKIIRNAIEHPTELKFRKIRKANPTIQRNVLRYEAAKDILQLVGFCEDVITDEVGKSEAYLVLKRNDPGLLWLVRSSLESCNA